jgi:ribosomal protein S18 acetylase RimI-like enzyme
MMLPPNIQIAPLHPLDFDEFMGYLDDHLSDNGKDGTAYFQPSPQGQHAFSPQRAAAFRSALDVPLSQHGWRRAWVARNVSGQIVGHVDLRSHTEKWIAERCLLGMGVDRDHRKMGLGTALIEHVERWAKIETAVGWIDLQVLSNNTPAIRLYLRAGFRIMGEVRDMFKVDDQYFSYTDMTKYLYTNQH